MYQLSKYYVKDDLNYPSFILFLATSLHTQYFIIYLFFISMMLLLKSYFISINIVNWLKIA